VGSVLTILHVLISVALVFAILLQSGKGGGLASTFGGGGGTGAVFGGRGAASFLVRATIVFAILFGLSCVTQSVWVIKNRASLSTSGVQRELSQSAPSATTPAETPTVIDTTQK